MSSLSRRAWLRQLGTLAALAALPKSLAGQTPRESGALPPPTPLQQAAMAALAQEFMEKFKVPGFSMAIGRSGTLLHEQGFGYADISKQEPVTPAHLFRIASISKPITAAAIFSLIEQGRLRLQDPVFGPDGLLPAVGGTTLPEPVKAITLHHLLTHTAGGWSNQAQDPMFSQVLMDQKQLIEWTLRTRPLEHPPGTHYAYSNFGYCVLGRVIEKITGQPYEPWVRENILQRCGVTAMQLGGNRLTDRKAGEVIYYDDGAGKARPYGMNVRRMDSHGGWLATPGDLVRFAQHVDGFPVPADILTAESIKQMTTPTAANPNYACGWSINQAANWWHNGSLPGTASILVRTARGFCWSGLINTRAEGVIPALDQLMWKLARTVPAWRV